MHLKNATRLLLATTLFHAAAVAQVRFCVGGTLNTMSQAQRSACNAKLQAVRRLAVALHAPDDWHFVLVCGETGWEEYSAYATGDATALASLGAKTDIDERETFLRDRSLDSAELTSLQGIVAHEIAAAVLRSQDEVAIHEEVGRRSFSAAAAQGT